MKKYQKQITNILTSILKLEEKKDKSFTFTVDKGLNTLRVTEWKRNRYEYTITRSVFIILTIDKEEKIQRKFEQIEKMINKFNK